MVTSMKEEESHLTSRGKRIKRFSPQQGDMFWGTRGQVWGNKGAGLGEHGPGSGSELDGKAERMRR